MLGEVVAESALPSCRFRIGREMNIVRRVMLGEAQRPGALRRLGDGADIEGGEASRRARLGREEILFLNSLDRHEGHAGGMGHGGQLAPPPDPDIAGAIGERGMEERDIGLQRRKKQQGIGIAIGIVDGAPIGPAPDQVAAQDPTQGHEGDALLRRLQPGMDGGTGGVADGDRSRLDRGGEASCRARLPQHDACRLDLGDGTGADQEIRLQPAGRHGQQAQTTRAPAQQRPRRRHGDADMVGGYGEQAAIGNPRRQRLEGEELGHVRIIGPSDGGRSRD